MPHDRWISIGTPELRAEIDPHGAQLSVLRDAAGRDLLWNGDPAVWKGRAPILFPIVGELAGGAYRLGNDIYRLPRHGFARDRDFVLESYSSTSARFCLTADDATLLVYPYRFALTLEFSVTGAALKVAARIENRGESVMPASLGLHPAFRWPLPDGEPRAAYSIEFEHEEPAPVRRLDGRGLLTPIEHPTPVVGRRLALSDDLFENDALIFDRLRSRRLTYGTVGKPRLRLEIVGATYLGIWSKPHAQFVCLEPWHGVADPVNYAGDFTEKPGSYSIEPRGSVELGMRIEVTRPGEAR